MECPKVILLDLLLLAGFVLFMIRAGFWLWELILIKRGLLPARQATTLADIKKMRDQGRIHFAVKRFQSLPENKGIYTAKGAEQKIRQL